MFQEHGNLIYLLFLIIFVETGLVIMLFTRRFIIVYRRFIVQQSGLNIFVLIPLLIAAAIIGDNLNIFVGKYFSEHAQLKFKGKPLVNRIDK